MGQRQLLVFDGQCSEASLLSVKHCTGRIRVRKCTYALVVKLVDTIGLGPIAERLGGSSPPEGTILLERSLESSS